MWRKKISLSFLLPWEFQTPLSLGTPRLLINLPRKWLSHMVKNLPAMWGPGFNPWVGEIPWRREWQPTPVFLPGESHEQRSLAGCSPWGHKESDTTEWLTHSLMSFGNCVCLVTTPLVNVWNASVTLCCAPALWKQSLPWPLGPRTTGLLSVTVSEVWLFFGVLTNGICGLLYLTTFTFTFQVLWFIHVAAHLNVPLIVIAE